MSDDMVDEVVGDGVEVNSSNFMGDDGLVEEMSDVENEIIVPQVGLKFADEAESPKRCITRFHISDLDKGWKFLSRGSRGRVGKRSERENA
ncbi:Hypothetical predicted protein [Olea europaea subsp. europaea]|uniref:Uncharacterized protein n=1 Tax=Olea europaea subsp. europaea TaxID=158383 RepID=A0A8S0T2D0_OLEEU|nr:Hypothetical predicted protein [Olea europaea subsp. europaea]